MWLGPGNYDPYGYFKGAAYIRGQYEGLQASQCYEIANVGPPNGSEQFWFRPVDANGTILGPPAITTAGNVVGSIWDKASRSNALNISGEYIK